MSPMNSTSSHWPAHDLIAEAAGNRVLQATLISLRQVQAQHYRALGSPESARSAVNDHHDLLQALRRGDVDAAEGAMRGHLDVVRRNLGNSRRP